MPRTKVINKLSFKKDPRETGLAAVGNPHPDVRIKLDGGEVGVIDGPSWQTKDCRWRVRVAIDAPKTPEKPAGFRWATFKVTHDSEAAARAWVKANWAAILRDHRLHDLDK